MFVGFNAVIVLIDMPSFATVQERSLPSFYNSVYSSKHFPHENDNLIAPSCDCCNQDEISVKYLTQ